MVVRPAEPEDRPELLNLIKGYFAFYRTLFPALSKIESLLDLLERNPGLGVQLVADAGGRLQGFASLYACLDTLLADRILVMNDLFVDPSSRNRGIGAALSTPAWLTLRRAVTPGSIGSPPPTTSTPSASTIATAVGAVPGSPTARPSAIASAAEQGPCASGALSLAPRRRLAAALGRQPRLLDAGPQRRHQILHTGARRHLDPRRPG